MCLGTLLLSSESVRWFFPWLELLDDEKELVCQVVSISIPSAFPHISWLLCLLSQWSGFFFMLFRILLSLCLPLLLSPDSHLGYLPHHPLSPHLNSCPLTTIREVMKPREYQFIYPWVHSQDLSQSSTSVPLTPDGSLTGKFTRTKENFI